MFRRGEHVTILVGLYTGCRATVQCVWGEDFLVLVQGLFISYHETELD